VRSVNGKVAFLFPAFSMKYRDASPKPVDGYADEVARLLTRASAVVEIDQYVLAPRILFRRHRYSLPKDRG